MRLTIDNLKKESVIFSKLEASYNNSLLYGTTDGKKIATDFEHRFKNHLLQSGYEFNSGNSSNGIDFPDLNVDIKTTSIIQPQSSSPFKSARQKIYGLGYDLLVFVYNKIDNPITNSSILNIQHLIYIDKNRTADFQLTTMINNALDNKANEDDIVSILFDKNLPIDDIEAYNLAKEILYNRPNIGYLTISNTLQWRLQYGRVIAESNNLPDIDKLL
ncbi:restriction endonuclease [Brachyspira catarrhinii]|uniref:Restriction endonuclease n=1 Tax=Brachyspira catarrhinii TaxID=2528966 RepID=A0ABY2TNM4_9SPIR|nr:restriction endonuclease [Brachyspira catarrhinii]TKZ28421.1 restriction endonuclease [Brachyspira catarrhinii]